MEPEEFGARVHAGISYAKKHYFKIVKERPMIHRFFAEVDSDKRSEIGPTFTFA